MPFATDQERALANLLVSVMNSREQEGARVSRILHDDVGQVLSAIGLQLDLLRMDLNDDPAAARSRIAEIQRMLDKAISHVRDLSYELNPSVVERTGLQCALDRLVGRFRKENTAAIRFHHDAAPPLPLEVANALYKIAEQALDNAARHAGASEIAVSVRAGHGVALEIRDNGLGFCPETAGETPGLGLHLMRHYAEQAGLRLSIASAPERGTTVRADFRGSPE